jgi:hypothetical protein
MILNVVFLTNISGTSLPPQSEDRALILSDRHRNVILQKICVARYTEQGLTVHSKR